MEPRGRTAMAIRTVRVTYRAAEHALASDAPELIPSARHRALDLLDRIAITIDTEGDPELSRLLEEARREVNSDT